MKYALAIATIATLGLALPASAEEVGVGDCIWIHRLTLPRADHDRPNPAPAFITHLSRGSIRRYP